MDNNQWKIFEDSRQTHFMPISNFHKLSKKHVLSMTGTVSGLIWSSLILFDAELINSTRQKTAVLQFFLVFFHNLFLF